MATPVLLMASSNEKKAMGEEDSRPEKHRSTRRNARSNGPSQKKQPQRGMGVAQLERLRLQERWKKMTEVNQLHQYQIPPPGTFSDYSSTTPSQFVPATYSSINGCAGQFQADPYLVGRELSSIPNIHCLTDPCDTFLKKKRANSEKLGFSQTTPLDDFDYLGLNLGRRVGFAHRIAGEEEEVVAVHRKGKSITGSVLMEYEFFPGKGGSRSTSQKELKLFPEASSTVPGEASSSLTTASTSTNTTTITSNSSVSSYIDLSLKLSF